MSLNQEHGFAVGFGVSRYRFHGDGGSNVCRAPGVAFTDDTGEIEFLGREDAAKGLRIELPRVEVRKLLAKALKSQGVDSSIIKGAENGAEKT